MRQERLSLSEYGGGRPAGGCPTRGGSRAGAAGCAEPREGKGQRFGSRQNPGWDAEPGELRRDRAGRRGGGESWQEVWKDLQGAAAPAGQPGVVIYPSSLESLGWPPLSLAEVGKRCKVILASGAGTGQSLAWPSPSTHRSAGQKYCM